MSVQLLPRRSSVKLPQTFTVVKAAEKEMVGRRALPGARPFYRWLRRVVEAMAANGVTARRQYGRSLAGQVRDMARLAVATGTTPEEYYAGNLPRHGGGPEIFDYVPQETIHAVVRHLSGERVDKLDFEERCRGSGLRVVRTLAVIDHRGMSATIPKGDIIVKPSQDWGGTGVECWRYSDGDCYTSLDGGKRLTQAAFTEHLGILSKRCRGRLLVQEKYKNHPALLPIAGSALSTFRIITMLNEAGEPEIVDAYYRTSVKPNASVDNTHSGGVMFPVDLRTGTFGIGKAFHDYRRITHHPQTGEQVTGRIHPGWVDAFDLALKGHLLFPQLVMQGWDIAFDPEGAIAVECNRTPEFSIARQEVFSGAVKTRAFDLLAFHCRSRSQLAGKAN